MRPVSVGWESTLRGSHAEVVRARVCNTFQTGTNPTGTVISVMDGAVMLDGNADIRSTVDLTTDGTLMWPTRSADLLAPYGNEVFIERGVVYSDDLVEYVSQGYFRIDSPDQGEAPDGPIRITGSDRMATIIEARLLAPIQFAAGTTLGSIVTTLIQDVYPTATITWDDATDLETLSRAVIVEEDRYGFLNDLVKAQGKIWYWDHRGELVIKDLPSATTSVFSINHGRGGVLVNIARHLTRSGVYNAVVASGEAADTGTPSRGVAVDASPTSPTYFYGRFGKIPRFYSSPMLATDLQAANAARAILLRQLGLPYVVDFGSIVNAALEPYDPVKVSYSDRDGEEMHVLATLKIPLSPRAAMTATTKEQTVVLVGAP